MSFYEFRAARAGRMNCLAVGQLLGDGLAINSGAMVSNIIISSSGGKQQRRQQQRQVTPLQHPTACGLA